MTIIFAICPIANLTYGLATLQAFAIQNGLATTVWISALFWGVLV
jgi:hypothetical protein